MDNNDLFICSCANVEHQLVFSYDEEFDDVFVAVHLKPERNIFKRICAGIKYIFGHRSRYGEFDGFIFQKKDADRLQKVVDFLRVKNNKR